jgi:hypothetical protein
VILTFVVAFLGPLLYPWLQFEGESLAHHLQRRWLLTFMLLYVPVLIMVLRPAMGTRPPFQPTASPGTPPTSG